ncbi:MAG: hypothetical protein CVV42_10155 [Candidatus Riflebacteria bacterium HGW-Riflebacteria-2]|nr:MAG: hypothetical protein CVV42_10155 [Candidatus Riflebacteria bacterium HGW-Riflebacteria-2]
MRPEFITDPARWQQVVDSLPDFYGKAYYNACYHKAYQLNDEGRPAALYFKQDQTEIFYPFLLRPIPAILGGDGFFDMQSAYGYGGPAVFGGTTETLGDFSRLHAAWAEKAGIVAEFVRFNPFLAQDLLAPLFDPELNRKTISIELNADFAVILRQASGPRQRNYRKAVRSGLSYFSMPDCDDLVKIYRQAMQRIGAEDYYYFSDRYFSAISEMPTDTRFFAGIRDASGKLIAGGIFLQDASAAHYHLGASVTDARALQADAFMLFEAARSAAANGRKILHLGGGLSLAEEDGLYRFKAGFSENRHNFYIARKIHRPEKYDEFSKKWQAITGRQPKILLHYHEDITEA